MSVALRVLAISVGIGGLAALVQLPIGVAQNGPGIVAGYVLALVALAWPAYHLESTFQALQQRSILGALWRRVRRGQIRMGWLLGGAMLVVTLLSLSSLAHLSAGQIIMSSTALLPSLLPPPESGNGRVLVDFTHPLVLLYWLLLSMVLLGPSIPPHRWRRWQQAGLAAVAALGVLAVGLVMGLLVHSLVIADVPLTLLVDRLGVQFTAEAGPATGASFIGGMARGAALGALSSLIGLGVIYTQVRQHPGLDNGHVPGSVIVGVLLWTLMLLLLAAGLREYGVPPTQGMAFFISALPAANLPWCVPVLIGLLAVGVLLQTAALLLTVLADVIPAESPGPSALWRLLLLGVSLVLSVALSQPDDFHALPLHRWLPMLSSVLLPLTALIMLSAYARSLPPPAMIWAQRRADSWSALLIYLYWRYPLRLAMVLVLLYSSGMGHAALSLLQSAFAR